MDGSTARVLDSFTDNLVGRNEKSLEDDEYNSLDDEDFLDLLEDDSGTLDALREKRMQELHTQSVLASFIFNCVSISDINNNSIG